MYCTVVTKRITNQMKHMRTYLVYLTVQYACYRIDVFNSTYQTHLLTYETIGKLTWSTIQ